MEKSANGTGKELRVIKMVVSFEGGTTLETNQGQIDGFLSHLSFRCHLPEVAFVGD